MALLKILKKIFSLKEDYNETILTESRKTCTEWGHIFNNWHNFVFEGGRAYYIKATGAFGNNLVGHIYISNGNNCSRVLVPKSSIVMCLEIDEDTKKKCIAGYCNFLYGLENNKENSTPLNIAN